ncbi:Purine ribonucleoside efflux pump NepI [compost metagenome]
MALSDELRMYMRAVTQMLVAVSEALAGQAVTVTAVVALFAGLLVPRLTRSIDRRLVLLSFTGLMILSSALVALSSSMGVLLVMRGGRMLVAVFVKGQATISEVGTL